MPHGPGTTPVDHAFRKDDRHDPEARTRTRPWRLDPGRWFRARSRAGASYPVDGAHSLRSGGAVRRSEEHTSELQSRGHLVCRLLLEKKKNKKLTRVKAREERHV